VFIYKAFFEAYKQEVLREIDYKNTEIIDSLIESSE
jgi:hypothetical protein